jgi:hypothetical protein
MAASPIFRGQGSRNSWRPKTVRLASQGQRKDAMTLPRRRLLHLAAGAAALPALSRFAWAQVYPTRHVRIVVGVAAGGPNDVLARIRGNGLSGRLGKQFII